jgi:hypothetical protein
MLLLTTNADEGALFVNPNAITYNNLTLHEYTRGLFPRLDLRQVEHIVQLYSTVGLSNTVDKASEIMGDCKSGFHTRFKPHLILPAIFVCPAYYLAEAFKSHAWKACAFLICRFKLHVAAIGPVRRSTGIPCAGFVLRVFNVSKSTRYDFEIVC